jgi:hypothetical protein
VGRASFLCLKMSLRMYSENNLTTTGGEDEFFLAGMVNALVMVA